MEIKEVTRSPHVMGDKTKAKEKLEALRREHKKMVKGRFEFVDAQSGFIEFNYRYFPEDLLVTYKFYHNEECEIPMGLVKHINNTVKKVRNFAGGDGKAQGFYSKGVPNTYETQSRIRFTPIEMF